MPIASVTVYCSSSSRLAPAYYRAAEELGSAIARNGWRLVYGGNCIGMMAKLADSARAAGGPVTGITPQLLVEEGIADRAADPLIVTADMRQRKALMESHGDAFVALPGGLGTFEEIFEIIVGRTLGCHDKPIILLNVENYWGPLLAMIDHGIREQFIRPKALKAFHVAGGVAEAIEHLKHASGEQIPQTPLSALE